MKKILLLGGSAQQIIAIETARRLGYYTILCDYLPNNPGQYYADKYYQESTTDKHTILKIAAAEKVNGILAFASDPAAPTAAFVAERLGLATNPLESVDILCNKDRFRCFLRENGYNAPKSTACTDGHISRFDSEYFQLPVIVKPVDSSGSKGATVLYEWDNLQKAVNFANSFSPAHRIIIEEYIEKKHEYLIGGDIFVVNGEIVLWGLLNCHRDNRVNPLVPVGKSYPLRLGEDLDNVKKTLNGIVKTLRLKSGSINVELIVDKHGKVWPIDIGPRAGGNMIPDLLSMIFGLDYVKLAVQIAMGEEVNIETNVKMGYYATHNLHSDKEGKFGRIIFSAELEQYIIKKCIYVKNGDDIHFFDNASKALGIVFMKFPDSNTQKKILDDINEHITIQLS